MADKGKVYKVKSNIMLGSTDKDGNVSHALKTPGSKVELTEKQAWEARHALFNPPQADPDPPLQLDAEGDELDVDEDELEEALESIRRRPDNPESGVQQHWKTDPLAIAAANGGDDHAAPGILGAARRPASNKTEMEKEEEEKTGMPAGAPGKGGSTTASHANPGASTPGSQS